MELFPSVPEDLEAVDRDELQGILDEFARVGAEVRADLQRPREDRVLIPAEATPSEITEALTSAASERARVAEALGARAEAEETFMAAVDESLAALGVEGEPSAEMAAESGDEPDPEPDPDDTADVVEPPAEELAAEVAPEPEPEPVQAPRMAIPSGPSRFTPPAVVESGSTPILLTTSGLGTIKVREGQPVSREQYAEHAMNLARRLGPVKHVRGGGPDRFSIGKVHFPFPEEMTLTGDRARDLEKLRAVSSAFLGAPEELEVFMASGGICAPPTPFYDVPGFASRARPVRGALPSYQATRGGVSVPSVATIDRSDSGVTVVEIDDDEQGGTFAAKTCRAVECATWSDVFVGIIAHCLEVGNLNSRTWPEGVALENDNLMAAWAGTAETRLLDRIKALSIQNTTGHVYNAVHDFIYGIARTKASLRWNLRAELDAIFTALIPEFVIELLQSDLAAQGVNEERYSTRARIETYFRNMNVEPVWVKDAPTGVTPFAAEVTGGGADSLDEFPTTVQYALFLNGTFLHLDGGSLELGLVRDSTLNETNDYQLFGESFENVARIGPEQAARWITATICPSGQFPALATALSC